MKILLINTSHEMTKVTEYESREDAQKELDNYSAGDFGKIRMYEVKEIKLVRQPSIIIAMGNDGL